MSGHLILKSLFSSESRIKLLAHFFLHPGESFYIRQLERLIHKPVGQIGPELQNLEKIGLLVSSREGNHKRYSFNKNFPIYDELRSIFLKTEGAGTIIKEVLSRLEKVELAFIYGSFASGEEHAGSDIDLMIVGDVSDRKTSPEISRAENELRRSLNYSLYSRKEVRSRLSKRDNFIRTVFKGPKIIILGSEDDELFRVG
jgi:predicted nucleotidyltransferase